MSVLKYYVKIKHYLRYEKKVNENKVFSSCEALRYISNMIKATKFTNPISFQNWNPKSRYMINYDLESS